MPCAIPKHMRDAFVSNATDSPWKTVIWGGNGVYSTRIIS